MKTIQSVKGQTFTIKRSKWLRGEGFALSRLLRRSDNKMCCLGQIACAVGYSSSEIIECDAPYNIAWKEMMSKSNSFSHKRSIGRMMQCNDNPSTSDKEKEARLKKLAKSAGFSLRFV